MDGYANGAASDRLHGLDAVRGFALIGGVALHATMSFFPGQQLWVVKDATESTELSALFYVVHIFRMAVFFLLAGFFGRLLLQRRGAGGFVRDRVKRIALPLAAFWPIVLAGIIAAIVWAAVQAAGGQPLPQRPPPPMTVETFPLTHLWFLYLLLIFYAAALLLRGLVVAADRGGGLRRFADRITAGLVGMWAPILLALPVAAVLALTPDWLPWFGVKTPDTGFVPNAQALTAYGLAFGLGWLVQRQSDLLAVWRRRWAFHLVLATVFTAGCLALIGPTPDVETGALGELTWAYALCYAMALWCWTFGLIGAGLALFAGRSPVRRYLADASYWIYLVHLPVVMALQVAVAPYDWPWPVKYGLVLGVGFALLLASYQLLVRHTFVGGWLNGRRAPKRGRAGGAADPLPAE